MTGIFSRVTGDDIICDSCILDTPTNSPANNYVGIAPSTKVTNDDNSFIIDNLNTDEEDADEEPG